jgi:hypothetical protein
LGIPILGTYDYAVVLLNVGTSELNEPRVISASGLEISGVFLRPAVPRINAGPMNHPPNDIFTVTWKNESGESFSRSVDLRKHISRYFGQEMIFQMDAEGNLNCKLSMRPSRKNHYLGETIKEIPSSLSHETRKLVDSHKI